jgi:hypothetical protein
MGQFIKRKRMQMWVACLAILLNALAPSLSHALMAPGASSNMMEICSAAGTRWISADLAEGSADASTNTPLQHQEHCPFCIAHADLLDLPRTTSFAVDGGHALFPSLFYHSPTPLFSWSPARPRGPPAR